MPEKIGNLQPPKGFTRFFFRAPIWCYRLGCGWLLGKRFLLLTHTGRKSGLSRQTVLEVVNYDKDTDAYVIASGYGRQSNWYRNILKDTGGDHPGWTAENDTYGYLVPGGHKAAVDRLDDAPIRNPRATKAHLGINESV